VREMKDGEGFNALTDTRAALQNASSIASLLLTTEAFVREAECPSRSSGRLKE